MTEGYWIEREFFCDWCSKEVSAEGLLECSNCYDDLCDDCRPEHEKDCWYDEEDKKTFEKVSGE